MTECRRVPKKVVLLPRGDVLKVEHEDLEDHTHRFDDFEVQGVSIDGRPAVRLDLRLSKEASQEEAGLKKERALLLLAQKERIHPVIHALSVLKAPFGCEGFRLASLEDHTVPFRDFLEGGGSGPVPSLVDSFFGCFLRLDELGLCLCDISPESFSMDPVAGHCFVSSWNPNMCSWMDQGLLKFFEDQQKREGIAGAAFARLKKRGTVCARVRGTQLYFMFLLLHMHLQEHEESHRGRILMDRLEHLLMNSCVPLQALASVGKELCKKAKEANIVETGGVFILIAVACKELLRPTLKDVDEDLQKLAEDDLVGLLEWFLVTYPKKHGLLEPSCSGKDSYVEVDHASFEDDERTLGGAKRSVFLAKYLGRSYPCPVSSFARRYELDEQLFSLSGGKRQQVHAPSMRVGY